MLVPAIDSHNAYLNTLLIYKLQRFLVYDMNMSNELYLINNAITIKLMRVNLCILYINCFILVTFHQSILYVQQ